MYALYAHRDGMANVFIRTFPRLSMMDSAVFDQDIEKGYGFRMNELGEGEFYPFPEGYEMFALNLETGEVLWFVDKWEEVQNDTREDFLSSFICNVVDEDDYDESQDPHIPSDDDLQFSFRNHEK